MYFFGLKWSILFDFAKDTPVFPAKSFAKFNFIMSRFFLSSCSTVENLCACENLKLGLFSLIYFNKLIYVCSGRLKPERLGLLKNRVFRLRYFFPKLLSCVQRFAEDSGLTFGRIYGNEFISEFAWDSNHLLLRVWSHYWGDEKDSEIYLAYLPL